VAAGNQGGESPRLTDAQIDEIMRHHSDEDYISREQFREFLSSDS
jgi:hypothetical protein